MYGQQLVDRQGVTIFLRPPRYLSASPSALQYGFPPPNGAGLIAQTHTRGLYAAARRCVVPPTSLWFPFFARWKLDHKNLSNRENAGAHPSSFSSQAPLHSATVFHPDKVRHLSVSCGFLLFPPGPMGKDPPPSPGYRPGTVLHALGHAGPSSPRGVARGAALLSALSFPEVPQAPRRCDWVHRVSRRLCLGPSNPGHPWPCPPLAGFVWALEPPGGPGGRRPAQCQSYGEALCPAPFLLHLTQLTTNVCSLPLRLLQGF